MSPRKEEIQPFYCRRCHRTTYHLIDRKARKVICKKCRRTMDFNPTSKQW